MLPESTQTALDFLIPFTGDGSGQQSAIVQFGIAALLWFGLLVISQLKYKPSTEPHESWLVWGFMIALGRELLMIAVQLLAAFGLVSTARLYPVLPPLEHALSGISVFVIASAYMLYLTGKPTTAKRFMMFSIACAMVAYLVTFWWWAGYVAANPESKFDQTWCDWVFRINATGWLGFSIIYLWMNSRGWIRNYICLALLFFFLSDFLKIPGMALGERFDSVLAPIRNACYLIGIPVLGYVYLREHATQLYHSFESLEATVQARTYELEQALHDLSRANERLLNLSRTDPLTGIMNRRAFEEEYLKKYAAARRGNTPIAVLLIDLDHFKKINDTYGHPVGDVCLQEVAVVLRETFRRIDDVFARYGGEEFIAVVTHSQIEQVESLAEKFRLKLAERTIQLESDCLQMTASVGIALEIPTRESDSSDLITRADDALYHAKTSGRNRVCVAGKTTGRE